MLPIHVEQGTESAFNLIKDHITSAPVLTLPKIPVCGRGGHVRCGCGSDPVHVSMCFLLLKGTMTSVTAGSQNHFREVEALA